MEEDLKTDRKSLAKTWGKRIERDGKTVGFATMSHELMEIVKIEGKDVQSPGMFVAFPLYGSPDLKDEIDVEA